MILRGLIGIALSLWASLGLALLGLLYWCATTAYPDFTLQILTWVQKTDWQTYFEQRVLPPTRYVILPWLLGGALLGWIGLSGLGWYHRQGLHTNLQALVQVYQKTWRHGWTTYTRTERLALEVLLLAFLARGIWYLHHYELQYDEAWTYNHFIAQGPIVSMLSPNNNHILYTLLACLTDWLPLEGKYSLRLPVLLGGLLLVLSAAWYWRQRWSWGWTFLALGWLAFCPGVSLYSLYARGYIFQMLCCFWGLAATLHLAKASPTAPHRWQAAWVVWIGSLILGLWSVPTHAYAAVVFSTALGVAAWRRGFVRAWVLANLSALMGAGLLYAPYFLTNGWTTLWEAASTAPTWRDTFWGYQDKVADWLLFGGGRGTPVYWFYLLWLGLLGLGAWRQWKAGRGVFEPLTLMALLLLPTLVDWSTGTQPPYRIWCFLSIPLAWSMGWLGELFFGAWRQNRWWLNGLVAGSILFQLWRLEQHYALQWSAVLDRQVKTVAQQLITQDIHEIYLLTHYEKPLLAFYYRRAQQPVTLWLSDPVSLHHAPLKRSKPYEALFWSVELPRPTAEERQWIDEEYPFLYYQDDRLRVQLSRFIPPE